MTGAPMVWIWTDDGVMRPARHFVAQADRDLCVGQSYILEPVDESQSAQDRAYHATMRDAWTNLPEHLAEHFPNPSDFRRYCLIECGFCDVAKLAFASSRAAMQALPYLGKDGAIVGVKGAVAIVKTPWSQKLRGGMRKEDRLRSYQETRDYAAALIGVKPDDLQREAGKAA